MDLASHTSPLESLTDSGLVTPKALENLVGTGIKIWNNGKYHVDDELLDALQVEGFGDKSSSDTALSLGGAIGSSPPAATKGRGLKKWRRVHREVGKTANSILDGTTKRDLTGETRQRSDGSVSTKNAMVNVLDNVLDHSPLYGDSGVEGRPIFAAREDSDNSLDTSNRSSTAAAAPRVRHGMRRVVSVEPDWNNIRSPSMNNSGITVQHVAQQGKSRTAIRKMARGVKIEKENSHSSMESNSRSSNFVFMQGTNSVTNNDRQSDREANYENEYNDKHLNKETQTAFSKNEAESEDVSQDLAADNSWEVKEEKGEYHVGSMDHDVLAVSMMKLHSAQEALEREVQKLTDVGKEDPLFFDDSFEPSETSNLRGHEFEEFQSGESSKTILKQNVVDAGLKTELEETLKQRMEAEVQYVAMSEAIQYSRAGYELMVQQKKVASEQVEVINKLEGAASKATELKRQAEKLEVTCQEILEREQVWKLQNRACRLTSCFTVQLILLLLVVYLFVLQFSSHNMEVVVVPT